MDSLIYYTMTTARYAVIIFSVLIIVRCFRSMLSERYESEIWACVYRGKDTLPIYHWENIIGRGASSDIRLDSPAVGRVHAVLVRTDKGHWRIFDIFSKGGVWVNGVKVSPAGVEIRSGDVLNLAGSILRFQDVSSRQRSLLEERRTMAGQAVSPSITLIYLTVFELFLMAEHMCTAESEHIKGIFLAFMGLICLHWLCYHLMRFINRSGFEVETLAFFLSALGMSVAAVSTPEDMVKQFLLTLTGVLLFLINGWWLRNLRRTAVMRVPVAVFAILLLALNILTSDAVFGARNWLEIGGYSFQPSEFVKVFYIYAGASTLDRLYRRHNLYSFIGFSALCVIALALIGDFGTALIFFVSFLVISFMRSGSIATVLLAISGAGLASFLAVTVKPYIADRFATWGHVWEDIYDKGYQQTRAMSAAASGGLFGKGAGEGWLVDIFAANTDMVFALISEELGMIVAMSMILAVLALAFFAVRSASHARSAYYSIAACTAMSMLLVQLSLNVFGSLDILPFTGVTFPFVSRGGSSFLSCWMMMAFVKSADNRRNASFAVKTSERVRSMQDYEDYGDYDDYDGEGEEY